MTSSLSSPLVHGSSLALAFVLACEVNVETPPDRADHDGAPLDADHRPEDFPPHPGDPGYPAYPGEGDDHGWPSTPSDEEPYLDLDPQRYPALIVLDAGVVEGPLAASGAVDAPLGFRAQMEWLAGDRDAIDFTRAWLEQWETVTAVGSAPVVPRPAVRARLLEPWLGASAAAASASDAGAAPPAYGGSAPGDGSPAPAWSDAPFRLIAIVNRVDLASAACESGGELRYVYTAIDPASGEPLEMTAILEIPYPSTRPAAEWARAWRDLAALGPTSAYASELERLAREVRAEADPLRVRLLTSEVELASAESPGWEMREFHVEIVGDELALVQAPLDRTPRADADAARLSDHVLAHADAIRGAGVALPEELQAGAAPLPTPDFSWRVLGVSESLRRAFSVQTCNGCHGGDTQTLAFQHIAPLDAPGLSARVSRFLYDPDAPSDELRRRAGVLEQLAQAECEPASPPPAYP